MRLSQARESIECSVADRRRLLEAHCARLVRESRVLAYADELRVRAEPEPSRAEDVVADGELVDGSADGFDHSRQLAAEDPPPRSADTKDDAGDQRDRQATTSVGFSSRTVQPIDRRGVDLDQDFVVLGHRPRDFLESLHRRWPIAVVYNSSHEFQRRLKASITTRVGIATRIRKAVVSRSSGRAGKSTSNCTG